jgi:hypothetical protein
VARADLAAAHPWLRAELYMLIERAKSCAASGPADGLEVNREPLSVLARYAFEQHITPRTLTVEELFPPL